MTVEQNVSYPLEVRKVPKRDAAKRVDEILEVVGWQATKKDPRPSSAEDNNSGSHWLALWFTIPAFCCSMSR